MIMGRSDRVGDFVGRLFGKRSELVHGNSGSVTDDELDRVETLACLLLAAQVAVASTVANPRLLKIRQWLA